MQCDRCSNEANIEVFVSDGTDQHQISLCFDCYQEIMTSGMKEFFSLEDKDLFDDFINEFNDSLFVEDEEISDEATCPKCGKSIKDIIKDMTFGCDYCYSEFEPRVSEILMNIQGSNKHIGHYPKKFEEINKLNDELQNKRLELEDSVMKEEYEKAAIIKRKIDELTSEIKTLSGDING